MQQITKISLTWELFQEGIPQLHVAKQVGVDRVTIYRWVKGITTTGELELFIDQYLLAKKGPRKKRKIDGLLKTRVWKLRETYRQCCGQKIQYFLKRDYGLGLGVKTIYKILGEKYQLRSKWKKNQKRGLVPEASKPREVVQMDTLDFGEVFAFTGIDIYSREADILLAPELTGQYGYHFLKQCIESFNRSLRKECLGWAKYRQKELPLLTREVEQYLEYYHKVRPHISRGMRPPLEG